MGDARCEWACWGQATPRPAINTSRRDGQDTVPTSNDIVARPRESEKDKRLQCCWGRLSESRRWMSELEYQIAPFP